MKQKYHPLLPSDTEAQRWGQMSFLVYLQLNFSVGGPFYNIFLSETEANS